VLAKVINRMLRGAGSNKNKGYRHKSTCLRDNALRGLVSSRRGDGYRVVPGGESPVSMSAKGKRYLKRRGADGGRLDVQREGSTGLVQAGVSAARKPQGKGGGNER